MHTILPQHRLRIGNPNCEKTGLVNNNPAMQIF